MGERGPKHSVLTEIDPATRAQLDAAIVEGSQTKAEIHKKFAEPHGIGYRAFCNYALALEGQARTRYVGELLGKVFGNLGDEDIDLRARGILMAMLDRIAGDVLDNGELKPKDLQHVVQSYDILRRGAIAEAQEDRRRQEWEVIRAAGVAVAANLIRTELAAELAADADLRKRFERVVDRVRAREDKPVEASIVQSVLKKVESKYGLQREDLDLINRIVGVNVSIADPAKSAIVDGVQASA